MRAHVKSLTAVPWGQMHGTLAIALPKFSERDFSTAATASDNVVDKWWGVRGVRDNYGSTMKFHARSTITRSKRTISSGTSHSFSFFFFLRMILPLRHCQFIFERYRIKKLKMISVFKVISNFVKNCKCFSDNLGKKLIFFKRKKFFLTSNKCIKIINNI